MKIDLEIPGGPSLHIERKPKEPMPLEKFERIINLIGGISAGCVVLLFFWILVG